MYLAFTLFTYKSITINQCNVAGPEDCTRMFVLGRYLILQLHAATIT